MPLLAAFQRLVDLLAEPEDIPILAPIIRREITYRLLVGDQGARLRQMASAGSRSHQIARAIDWLKGNFTRPLRIDDLAARVGMSGSTFHHHFRSMTASSPLQFQKQLRLHEARRLMLTDHLDAAAAAFEVGYESPSQFSREYKSLFGAPPLRDITTLRQLAAGESRQQIMKAEQVRTTAWDRGSTPGNRENLRQSGVDGGRGGGRAVGAPMKIPGFQRKIIGEDRWDDSPGSWSLSRCWRVSRFGQGTRPGVSR